MTTDRKTVEVWELRHQPDAVVLSAWAEHFRNHYCLDAEIDYFRRGYKSSRKDYLNAIKFPDLSSAPGPSIRAGDFGEILVADFLEYELGYWVPRTRYSDKTVRNESTKGCDILGFHFVQSGNVSLGDTLAIFEAKAQFSGKIAKPRLQDAVDGSALDFARKAESLNAIKQRLFAARREADADRIDRFQNPVDHPYTEVSGAVALVCATVYDGPVLAQVDTSNHPNRGQLRLLVIRGTDMMTLTHSLYQRAADEA